MLMATSGCRVCQAWFMCWWYLPARAAVYTVNLDEGLPLWLTVTILMKYARLNKSVAAAPCLHNANERG